MRSKSIKLSVSLPNEIVLEIFKHIPSRQLTKFMVLSRAMNVEIKKILVKRFNDVFWNPHRRILVMITRYVLDFVPIHNTFDLGFKSLDNENLIATFQQNSSQRSGMVGPNNKRLWGFKLRGDGILRENPLNEPLIYTTWDSPYEQKETRLYTFDSNTDSAHPFIKTFFVTNGAVRIPCDDCEETKGSWTYKLFNNDRKRKNANFTPKVEFEGRNEKKYNGPGNHEVVGTLKTVRIQAPMLLASIEEKKKDKYVGGLKYIVMEGGQHLLKRKRNCVIS
ncbi:hypothetical protein RhiirC2_741698 [Rhizophagus irregularis]|uniref:F-box domain-containing protein n=1 Tax=Rhizophagus irregularis TaxID=588596 RepID=A0A2N1NGB7_9GLOM|nr:hypothetical protein RhiirC2_741698 [Rhizophagus irregularis]